MRALVADFYELSMANSYFQHGRNNDIAYFDYYFRRIPDKGGYAIFAGLTQVIEYLENLKFSPQEIEFLRQKNSFSEDFLEYLTNFRFTGDIWAMAEGSVVFPNEPILTVHAPLVECQLIEMFLLATLNHQSLIATKTARVVQAAQGRKVFEFGARRAHGVDAALYGARAAYIAGITATSNVEADYLFGVPSVGTMAHSFIQSFKTEYEAFLAYAKTYPENTVLLVDTYDTLRRGIPNAIRVHNEYLKPNGYELKGIRIDSGDLAYLSNKARELLDNAGLTNTQISVSNSLDEYLINGILTQTNVIDSFGVGENLITAKSEPIFGGVYKIVALKKDEQIEPKIKLSESIYKTTTPAVKQVWRLYDENNKAMADVVSFYDEVIDEKEPYLLFDPEHSWKQKTITNFRAKALLQPQILNGRRCTNNPTLEEIRNYCKNEQETLWTEVKRLDYPHKYFVDLSRSLWVLKQHMINEYAVEKDEL